MEASSASSAIFVYPQAITVRFSFELHRRNGADFSYAILIDTIVRRVIWTPTASLRIVLAITRLDDTFLVCLNGNDVQLKGKQDEQRRPNHVHYLSGRPSHATWHQERHLQRRASGQNRPSLT